jgi:hypothetical protein
MQSKSESERFTTSVVGIEGIWPEPPDVWSHSSLRDAEECPLRYQLRRAEYPGLWNQRGYPDRPFVPALIGDVIHRCVEILLREFHSQGCNGVGDPSSVGVLRGMGGYSALVGRVIEERLNGFDGNPRASRVLDQVRTNLNARVPEIRQRVQLLISGLNIEPSTWPQTGDPQRGLQRRALELGSHPEVWLEVPSLQFAGKADLISVSANGASITDFKTGARHESHDEQLRTYALLWTKDRDRNPNDTPVAALTISYPDQDVGIDPPSGGELQDLAERLQSRVETVALSLQDRPPPATLPESCFICSVRHLCDAYWSSARSADTGTAFGDFQVHVVDRNGPRSWNVLLDPGGDPALFRTTDESVDFRRGDRLRILSASRAADEDSGTLILTEVSGTEVFPLMDVTS